MSRELAQVIQQLVQQRLSRRDFIVKASALGLSMGAIGTILSACGGAATPAATGTATVATSTPTAAATGSPTPTTSPTPTPTATATATEAAAGAKILRVRLTTDIQNLDPAFRVTQNDDDVSSCVNNGLVTYAANSYDIVNDLAESIDKSADGLTITFKLKEGVMWHNGYGEVTTDDVKFSYERYIDPKLNAAYKDDWAALDHVEIIDKYNGKIVFKEPFAPVWHSSLPVASGYVLCKKYLEEVGPEKYATQIIGSGPYLFSDWKPKQQVTLKKNPDYTGDKKAAWDEIYFIPIDDDKTAEVALEAGELDWTKISNASVSRFESNPSFKVLKKPSLQYFWVGMNMANPKLQDINVRQAIRYAIDVPSIIQAAYQGQVEQAYELIAPGLTGYWKDAPKYQRDVAKAKDFLTKAGVNNLELQIAIEDTTEFRTYAEVAQQNLAEVGVTLTINAMDTSTFWGMSADQQKTLELFAMSYSLEPDPSWFTMWFTCDQIGVWNWMSWCSSEYDTLHKQGLVTLDDAEREKIYIRMQGLWDEACHTVWVTHGQRTYAYVPTISPATTPHGLTQPVFFEPA